MTKGDKRYLQKEKPQFIYCGFGLSCKVGDYFIR